MRLLKPKFVKLDGPKPPKPITHGQFQALIRGNEDWFEKIHRTWFGMQLRLLILAKVTPNDIEAHLIEVSPWQSRDLFETEVGPPDDPRIRITYRVIMPHDETKRDEISQLLEENGNRVVAFH